MSLPELFSKGKAWRGECIRCRHIWFSKKMPKKCPNCGFNVMIMRDKLEVK